MPTDGMIDIWLYVNRQGKLLEIPACVSKKKPSKWSYAIPAVDRDNYTYIQEVAREPGMIFENSVWFKKKNLTKAKELFMTDYMQKVKDLYNAYTNARSEMAKLDTEGGETC